jgi:small subunit ribosomal protein S1
MADQGGSNQRGGKRPSQKEAPPKKGPIVEHRPGGLNVRRKVSSETEAPAAEASAPSGDAAAPAPALVVQPSAAETPAAEPDAPASARVFRSAKVEPTNAPPPAAELPVPVETESFADMFARSESGRKRFAPGQKVKAKILQVGRDTAFLDLGGKNEALIDSRELRAEDGTLRYQVGQTLEGFVRSLEDGVWVTLTIPKGARREALAQAREGGIPVEGTVSGVNKGGLEVDLGGGTRAFCPSSQADVRFVEDLSGLVGQKLKFLVSELRDRDIVLSRRAYLAREAAAKADELRDTLTVGAHLEGKVVSLRDFGAFVDLGGLEGLVPISELSHRHVAHPSEVLKIGQTVTVEVARIESGKDGKEKISLSLKSLEGDPWEERGNAITEGQRLQGKVVRLQPFGAFVELFPGVDGLVHVSRLTTPAGKGVTHPKDALAEGQTIWVEVETVDRTSRKLGLRPITAEEAAVPAPVRTGGGPRVGEVVEATVDKVESFGLFVRWPGGRGLLPVSELGTPYGADLRRAYAIGAKIKASIVEIDTQGRLRLSKIAAEQAQERAEVAEYLNANQRPGKGLGTLADLLKVRKS